MGQRSLTVNSSTQPLIVKITKGPHKGESFSMSKQVFTIGRNANNDIVLPNDSKISRNHLIVSKRNSIFIVNNLSKRNPILQDLVEKNTIEMYPGNRFQVGESELEFVWNDPNIKVMSATFVPPVQKAVITHNSHDLVIPRNYELNQKKNEPQKPQKSSKKRPSRPKPKNNFLLIAILLIGGLLFFIFQDNGGPKKNKKNSLRSSEEIQKTLEASKLNIVNYTKEKRIQEDGTIDKQFESSQAYYIRGFRDYRQGQYSRAIQAFQAALSFDPMHSLSRKYLNMSVKKLDELVQFNISQGRRYREKNNYRLCKSAFQQVMIIKKDPNEKTYKEAKQLFDECDTLHKGRY